MTATASKLRIVAIGRDRAAPESALVERYVARIRPPMDVVTLPDGRGNPVEIKRREAEQMLGRVRPTDFVIALDQGGQAPDTAGFAALLTKWRETGRPLAFLIGGAEGLDRSVLDRADAVLSLGALTLPHLLARAILAEQIYRAQSLLENHPYHRAGRPLPPA